MPYYTYLLYLLYLLYVLTIMYLRDLYHMLVCTHQYQLSGTTSSYLELPENNLEPPGAIWRYLELSAATWSYLQLSEPIWSQISRHTYNPLKTQNTKPQTHNPKPQTQKKTIWEPKHTNQKLEGGRKGGNP